MDEEVEKRLQLLEQQIHQLDVAGVEIVKAMQVLRKYIENVDQAGAELVRMVQGLMVAVNVLMRDYNVRETAALNAMFEQVKVYQKYLM